ncbi:MAG: hypothetical protein MJ192_10135 [Clostridia bacterium]|nr:hypothetical protein [Clostridia bacterium]
MIDEIAALAPSGASPLETALFFHDYLVEHFEYDTSYENYEMYAMLTTGRGVCQAYTHLYIELLTRCGIPASYCECGEINHIWTVIALDGRTYHIDVTWDDPVGNMPGKVPHKYFLLTDEEMRLSHGTKWICTETCSDTRFSDWWLRDVETAVRMTDGGVYAVADNRLIRAKSLLADSTESLTDLGMWKIGSGGRYWRGCYAGLCLCGDSLYVNACDRVLRCDPMTAAVTETGISTKNDWFYGMTSDGHTLTLHISTGEDPVTITETRTVVP